MPTAADHRQADDDELTSRLNEAKQELFNLRFQLVTGQLDNSSRIGQIKKEVARILTVLREREISEAEALEAASEMGAHQRAEQHEAAASAAQSEAPAAEDAEEEKA